MNVLRRNAICTVACDGAYNVAMLCCTGAVIQTFLREIGFAYGVCYFFVTRSVISRKQPEV